MVNILARIGTHFRSYLQPFLVLSAISMGFFGVLIGLLVSREPPSLYTLYCVIALGGIAANGYRYRWRMMFTLRLKRRP